MASKTKKVVLPVVDADDASVSPDCQTNNQKGMACSGCALERKGRVSGSGAPGEVDIMFVSESPSSWSVNNKEVFYGRGGRIIRQTWKDLRILDEKSGGQLRMKSMRKWDTYAVQCQVEEGRDQSATVPKAVIDRCSVYLRSAIKNKRPKVIVVMGTNALKALGYKGDKFMEARGRLLEMEIAGHRVKVIPTFSTKHLMAKTGLFNLFYNDFVRAVRIAAGIDDAAASISIEELTKEYQIPKTVEEVKDVCDLIIDYVTKDAPPGAKASQCSLAVDTETNTVNPHREDAKVLCISFAWDVGKSTAIPLYHKDSPWTPEQLEEVIEHVQRVLACPKPKVFHNAKFDLKFLELRHGFRVHNVMWDTMLGEHLLREDMTGAYSLKILGRSYFPQFANYADKVHELATALTFEEESVHSVVAGCKKGKVKKGTEGFDDGMVAEMGKADLEKYLFGAKKDRKKRTFDSGYERVDLDILLVYAAIDTDLTRRLLRNQFTRMKSENFMAAKNLMNSHCVPGSRSLGRMEFKGMKVDKPYLEFLETELSKVVAEKGALLNSFWRGDGEFNPNSTQHVGRVLYLEGVPNKETGLREIRLGPWVERNKKSEQWKTDKKTLRAIAEKTDCLFTKTLLEYRSAHKALSGFVHDIKLLAEYDGNLHTNFHLHGTSTGRLSSNNLNMQNLPPWLAGFNIKKIFIPDDGEEEVIVNLDYKGAEIRVFTAYAPDPQLIDALNAGLDVHSWFTQEIFGIPYEEVELKKESDKKMKALRTTVKRVVFGILYGAMAKKIAETAGISEEEAQNVIDKLFLRFPSLKGYMDATVAQIHLTGFVETLFYRRRRFPLQNVNGFFRGQAERRGKNMKIQSTSSDIVLGQLVELDEHMHEVGGRLLITVHDSIVATCKKKYLHQLAAFLDYYCVKRVAEKYPWLPVSFACDISVGPSYGEQMSIAEYIEKTGLQRELTPDEALLYTLDEEALNELREDEEEVREREAVAAAVG
jgi:uracil-DNA glycosylase family 4